MSRNGLMCSKMKEKDCDELTGMGWTAQPPLGELWRLSALGSSLGPLLTLMPTPQLLQRECSQPRGSATGATRSLLTIATFHLLFQLALFRRIVGRSYYRSIFVFYTPHTHTHKCSGQIQKSVIFPFHFGAIRENWMADIIFKRKFENNLGHSEHLSNEVSLSLLLLMLKRSLFAGEKTKKQLG